MKTENDIEQLLTEAKRTSLSNYEKEYVKSTLLEHAKRTLNEHAPLRPSPWRSWALRGSISFASLLIVFVGTAYASHNSLPGEPLYALKVDVVEEMIALTKISTEDRVAYDIHLMETRLDEIKKMVHQGTSKTPKDLAQLTDQIDEHVTDMTSILKEKKSDHISHEEKINMLAKLSGVAKAQSKSAQGTLELTEAADTIVDTQESISDAMITAIEDFIEDESMEVLYEYLSEKIIDVSEYVTVSTTDESARDTVERHLHDAEEALFDGHTKEAIISILRAQEVATIDGYLDEKEGTGLDTQSTNGPQE